MKITESQIKQLIKEEIMKGLSQREYETSGYDNYPHITDDMDVLTVGELKNFLEVGIDMGDKMCESYLRELDLMVNYVTTTGRKYEDDRYNVMSDLRKATADMQKKVCGVSKDAVDKNIFWEKFNAAAGDPNSEYDYISSEEAQQRFGLTNDEKYAYEKFVE